MPVEVERALTLLRLGERFGRLPSEVAREDAEILRLVELEQLAGGE